MSLSDGVITKAFCSVVSWSARNERSSREESSNFESYQFQQQIEQQRSMQQHMQWMQQQETLRRQSQERQGREQESQVTQGRQERQESVQQEARSQEVTKTQERSTSRKGARTVIDILKHNKEEKQEKEAASSAASLKKASLGGKETAEAAEVTKIPVKNYRSRTLSRSGRRREPSPPVDYPSGAGAEYSDDTDETNDVRIAEYEAGHGGRGRSMRRKASTQSFSKKTSVTRNYPGCVIA